MSRHFSSFSIALAIVFLHLRAAVAQNSTYGEGSPTEAQCQVSFAWMDDEEGQDPCTVSSWLLGTCLHAPNGSAFEVLPQIGSSAGQQNIYLPLNATDDPTGCHCNTVIYSLIQACQICQGGAFMPWFEWNVSCSSVSISSLPSRIPFNVSVPPWAYLDVVTFGFFNETIAKINATGTGLNSKASHSHAGAIAGGVVGGVAALGLVALLFYLFMRHRRQAGAKSSKAHPTAATDAYYMRPSPNAHELKELSIAHGRLAGSGTGVALT